MLMQSLEPTQLVVELGAGRGIAVRQVQTADDQVIDTRFQVSAVQVLWIPRQPAMGLHRIATLGQDCDAVIGLLAVPNHTVAGIADRLFGKLFRRCFQLLQADNIRHGERQPPQQNRQAAIYPINVVGSDSHGCAMALLSYEVEFFCALCLPLEPQNRLGQGMWRYDAW